MMRVHLHISGRVQGVFYRATMRDVALELGLKGWVKNRYDGGVESIAEGDNSQILAIVEWCKTGPPTANVTDVDVVKQEATDEFDSFSIKY